MGALTCLLALATLPAAAEVDIHASLNRDSIALGETVELTVAVTGSIGRVTEPRLPALDYLEIVSTSSQQSIEFVNGRMSSTRSYVFVLRPTREGKFTIPGLEVNAAGQVYTTRPVTLTVAGRAASAPSPGAPPSSSFGGQLPSLPGAQPPPIKEIDARLEVDNPTPYVGQQVILTMSFYQAHTVSLLGSAEYLPPTTEGLMAEALPDEPAHTETIGGIPFAVVTRRTALFAPAPGEYTIGPATVEFRRSYMGGDESITTDPVVLKVRPLPSAGRPEDFSGIVGHLRAHLQAPADHLRVGEAMTVRLTVEGTGDLRQLQAPELTVSDGARVYPTGEQREVGPRRQGQELTIGGVVNFDYLVMPQRTGTLTIAPITISFFDAESGRYGSTRTDAVTLQVEPGEGGETSLRPEGGELRPLKEGGLGLRARTPVTSSPLFWLLQLIPTAGLGWALVRRSELQRRQRDPRYRRFVEAEAVARARLRSLPKQASAREMHVAADATLAEYLAAKTDAAAASLSPEEARALLTEAGCRPDTAARAEELLRSLRHAVYAPPGTMSMEAEELGGAVLGLITQIEGELR